MPFLTAGNSGFATLEFSGFATSGNSARRKKVKSGIELFSDLFSSALEKAAVPKSKVKSKRGKRSKKLQKILWGIALDMGIIKTPLFGRKRPTVRLGGGAAESA